MIDSIVVGSQNKTIPAGFRMDLGKLTVVTGENNTGKTNFVKTIVDGKNVQFLDTDGNLVHPKIIYIAADNIAPAQGECKASAKGDALVVNLAELFSNLNVSFHLTEKDQIVSSITRLVEKANENLVGFTGVNGYQLRLEQNDEELDGKIIIQALIKKIVGLEGGDERDLGSLGQGTQRVIVASVLKAYNDILRENGGETVGPTLILFEEPEVYLHPKLKRKLNATLEAIAQQDSHQVVITTHDPYFAFKETDEDWKKIFSFTRDGQTTEVSGEGVINGIEDELLFIFLYNQLKRHDLSSLESITVGEMASRNYIWPPNWQSPHACVDLENMRNQIHHPAGDNINTIGRVSQVTPECEGKNYYFETELAEAVQKMSVALARVPEVV